MESSGKHDPVADVLSGLRHLGYLDALLQEDYAFPDWFENQRERRSLAVAFGQTPVSYESACIGVVRANGQSGHDLIDGFRSLGAPVILEIDREEIREWAVSLRKGGHYLVGTYSVRDFAGVIAQRAQDWKPDAVLRAKNIGEFGWSRQPSLFSGLIPELESQIQEQLDPLLRQTLAQTKAAYTESSGRDPNARDLFKLVFWTLTAKVFFDRQVPRFANLSPEPDSILSAVAKHYNTAIPRLLNADARAVAARAVWNELDFRNLSVEVLSQIWSTTLVDQDTKKRLGIHRTPRAVVQYIIERIPFSPSGDDERIVFEPCCGSAAFLIGAMKALRQRLYGASSKERHRYFVNHIAGLEYDPFAVEISTLCLTLADFPNPNGWDIQQGDVFEDGSMSSQLRRAGVVLCNPPFEAFDVAERKRYDTSSPNKPAELLLRVLKDLHQSAVLGFVLPRVAVDGQVYASVRKRLAERFSSVEFTVLPDKVFKADAEVALLVATEPIPHDVTRVRYRRVNDNAEAYAAFEREHTVSVEHSANFSTAQAKTGFAIPDLPEVWNALVDLPTLGTLSRIHRGIEWNMKLKEHYETLVRDSPAQGYRLGVPPKAQFDSFIAPTLAYLSVKPEHQLYQAWRQNWSGSKAILNKTARSRGPWRLSAFPDTQGLVCYQTFFGIWPTSPLVDEVVLAAVLNSPVANAFVWAREGKVDVTKDTLELLPMPVFSKEQRKRLYSLVEQYQSLIGEHARGEHLLSDSDAALEIALKEIDAVVLDAYGMPAKMERKLLDLFNKESRTVSHQFGSYFDPKSDVAFSLSDSLRPGFANASGNEWLKLTGSQ